MLKLRSKSTIKVHGVKLLAAAAGRCAHPPTHRWAWVEDACVFRFEGTQVVSVRLITPACGGLAGMLAQLEITIP